MSRRPLLWALLALTACNPRPSFGPGGFDPEALGSGVSAGFLMGVATSSHQVEGGNTNDWTDWEASTDEAGNPRIHGGDRSGAATESYERFEEDLALMQQLGVRSYRFSVEWSRLEPEEGVWREDVAAHYLDWARRLRAAGIEPMVTLYHFTLPRWVAAAGGWENDAVLGSFERFSGRVGAALGAEVDLWCTVNEPNVLAVESFLEGAWPPGKTSNRLSAEVLARLLEAHAGSARALRAHDAIDADGDGRATLVGLAHHVRIIQAATPSTLDVAIAGLTDDFFNESTVRAAKTGRIQLSVPGEVEIDRAVEGLAGSFDYLGINYYTRDHVRADLGDPSFSRQYVPEGRPRNDLDWDIYPEGLYQVLRRFSSFGWPIYVTENGIADSTGEVRPDFLRNHFHALERAVADGVDVRGYYHWSLLDNFEWAEGYAPKFGLFKVDFESPQKTRTPTPAVEAFRKISERVPRTP